MWGNTDQKNSVFGQFSRSQSYQIFYLRFVDAIMSEISKIRNVRYFSGISTLILKSPVNGGVVGLLSPFFHCFSSSFSFAIPFLFWHFAWLLNLPLFEQFLYLALFTQFFSVMFLLSYILVPNEPPSDLCHLHQKNFHHCQKKKLQYSSLEIGPWILRPLIWYSETRDQDLGTQDLEPETRDPWTWLEYKK